MKTNKLLNKKITHQDFQDYIDMASEVFATKIDLKKFATKADLKKFATKDDLKKFATKEEMLEIFATKEDLKEFTTKTELIEFKDEILNSNDKIAGKLDKFLTEQTMQTVAYNRHDKEIEKIKGRVEIVEKKIGLKPVL